MKLLKALFNTMAKEKSKEVSKKKLDEQEVKEVVVDLQNPAFDPDIPEQKQRHFR